MSFVWSIDEVVMSGKTAVSFKSVHCTKCTVILMQHFTVLDTYNKKHTNNHV